MSRGGPNRAIQQANSKLTIYKNEVLRSTAVLEQIFQSGLQRNAFKERERIVYIAKNHILAAETVQSYNILYCMRR